MADKRNILITGGTGFIGRNMAEAFAGDGNAKVTASHLLRPPADIPGVDWLKADLTRAEDVERAIGAVDVLVHAAAVTSGIGDTSSRPQIHVTDNAVMNSLVFRRAFEAGVKHVIFFSCTVMHQSSEKALTEDDFDANAPMTDTYFGAGWTKVYFEKMSEFFARQTGGPRFTVIRHSNVYGPHDKYDLDHSHMFGATVTKVMTAKDGKVTVWGDGTEKRDLIYVDDLVDFVRLAVEKQSAPHALYNVGSGSVHTVGEVVEKIIKASGRDLAVSYDPSKPSAKVSVMLDISKAKRELGWAPRVNLDDGIGKTLSWWRENVPAT